MKFIMLLFSMYLLALPVVSCAEALVCADEVEFCAAADDCTDGCNDEGADGCGAFCACSCCVHIVSVNYQSPVTLVSSHPVKNITQVTYDNITLPSNYFGNIWQPPRVA